MNNNNNNKREAVNVTFSHVICNVESVDHISYVVVLNNQSQTIMANLINTFEKAITASGIPIQYPRSAQEPFHSTLAVVNSTYPVATVLDQLNTQITVWNSQPILIDHFLLEFPPHRFSSSPPPS